MAPVVPALLMAGKLGLKFLPAIGAVAGAAPGLRRGNIGEALLGGGLGALTGTSGGPLRGLTAKGIRMAGSPGAVRGAAPLPHGRVARPLHRHVGGGGGGAGARAAPLPHAAPLGRI